MVKVNSALRLSIVGALLAVSVSSLVSAKHLSAENVLQIRRDHPEHAPRTFLDPTCKLIASSISNASAVYGPGTKQYNSQMEHWCSSSTIYSACVVEPATVQDVSVTMRIISNSTTKFAIRGAGHSCAGFSSTSGVQISMIKFQDVVYQPDSQTAVLGMGLIWDTVYAKLEPFGVNVVGGRVSGVGVAGFSLGGGYSWLSNQHGLTCDTAVAYELVLPSGQILDVTQATYPDLMYGLKGGLNNFGVVTRITLQAFPQGPVWGGNVIYTGDKWDKLSSIIANFSQTNNDPKANILPTYNVLAGLQILSIPMFYNGPTPPPGLFDALLSVPSLSKDISTRSFLSLVQATPTNATAGLRGTFTSVSLATVNPAILSTVVKEARVRGTVDLLAAGVFVSYDVEPFLNRSGQYPTASQTAWPHTEVLSPLNLYFAWPLGLSDDIFYKAIQDSAATIRNAAIQQGQKLDNLYTYPNYAFKSDSIANVYGPNVPSLKALAAKYDPGRVMTRTSGFIFQNA